MRRQGRIDSWNDAKGYGFIIPAQGGERVFLHISAFSSQARPTGGEVVSYESALDAQGRRRAVHVRYVGAASFAGKAPHYSRAIWPALLFMLVLSVLAVDGHMPMLVAALYVAASLICFIAYAYDKRAAKAGQSRTPETTLHLLAVFGGWPGALLAQRFLRHKSSKRGFLLTFRVSAGLNVAGLAWLLSPYGERSRYMIELLL